MKIVIKAVATAIINFIMLIVWIFLFDNIADIIVGEYKIYLKDWWKYELVENKIIYYVIATALLSGVISLVWYLSMQFISSLRKLFLGLVVGCFMLIGANCLYWNYLEKFCFDGEWSALKETYVIYFKSYMFAQCYFMIAICFIYVVGIAFCCCQYFFKNSIIRTAGCQICSRDTIFREMLCYGIPGWIYVCGEFFLTKMLNSSYIWGSSVLIVIYVVIYICLKIIEIKKCSDYYLFAIKRSPDSDCIIMVTEADDSQMSYIYHKILKNKKLMAKLNTEKICVLPKGLCEKSFEIVLDIYSEWIFIKNNLEQQKILNEMISNRGIFNIAYCETESVLGKLENVYDYSTSDIEDAVNKIIQLKEFIQFRRKQMNIISNIQSAGIIKTNCILDEIVAFKQYFICQINSFIVFDYTIKWLEILNYMYTLVMISSLNMEVSEAVENIKNADFEKWRKLRAQIMHSNTYDGVMDLSNIEKNVFEKFDYIWNVVTSRGAYAFQEYTLNELLEAANKLRDYTRGHGVFTFEISQEINLALTEVVVVLINQLIQNYLINENYQNLEKLGWVVYSGEVPYFLYSYNDVYKEYRFDSFQRGNSIMLPVDIRGYTDEKNN